MANEMSYKTHDKSTVLYAKKIISIVNDLEKYKNTFNIKDYQFLSTDRMAKEYIDYIKL